MVTFQSPDDSRRAQLKLTSAAWQLIDGTEIMGKTSSLQQFARIASEYRTWPHRTSLALLPLFPAEVIFTFIAEKRGQAAARGTWSWEHTSPDRITLRWSPVMFFTLLPQGALGPMPSLPSSTKVLESLKTKADAYFLRNLEELGIKDLLEN